MQQNLNLINPVPIPIWAELGPAQPQLVSVSSGISKHVSVLIAELSKPWLIIGIILVQ